MTAHVVYSDTAAWMKRTARIAAKMLDRYLKGKTSAAAWARAEVRASIAKREHWQAESVFAEEIRRELANS